MGDDNILTFQRTRYKRKAKKPKESDWQRWFRRYKQSAMDEPLYAIFVTTGAVLVGGQLIHMVAHTMAEFALVIIKASQAGTDVQQEYPLQ